MVKGIIYKWTNKINHKCYIGKTTNPYKRKWSHIHDRRFKSAFHDAIDKYGIEMFDYEVLIKIQTTDYERLNYILNHFEKFYIKKYKSNEKDFGYNLTIGGDGIIGRFGELNPFFGKHHTLENRLKHSIFLKGQKQSEATKKKRNESLRKVIHTEEWNKKVGEAHQKTVYAFKDGELVGKYKCYNDCLADLNLPYKQGISKVIKGIRKTYYGYYFQNKINKDNVKQEDINDEEG